MNEKFAWPSFSLKGEVKKKIIFWAWSRLDCYLLDHKRETMSVFIICSLSRYSMENTFANLQNTHPVTSSMVSFHYTKHGQLLQYDYRIPIE